MFFGDYELGAAGAAQQKQLKNCINLYYQASVQGARPYNITQSLRQRLNW
jgi:hypothetical protein